MSGPATPGPWPSRRGLVPRHAATRRYALRRTLVEFFRDAAFDEAAALTYFAVLSLLPAVLAAVSILGVVGQAETTTAALLDFMHEFGDDEVADVLAGPISDFASKEGAGWLLLLGLVGAMWFASNYVQAFGRSLNRIYRVDEGRPALLMQVFGYVVTAGLVVMAVVMAVLLVVSGAFARQLVRLLELPPGYVTVWTVGKWPLLVVLVLAAIAVLYHLTANVRPRTFSPVTPGALCALALGALATAGLGLFMRNFPNFNYYYGALTGVLVFLAWLYIINVALLLGAHLNAELERGVQLEAGVGAARTIRLPVRSTRTSAQRAARYERLVRQAEVLRETRGRDAGTAPAGKPKGDQDSPS